MTDDNGNQITDPDARDCPACGKTFIVIDGKDWARYAGHLRGHVTYTYCFVCGDPVDHGADKFDPLKPVHDETAGRVYHLKCEDEVIVETTAKVGGKDV